MSDKFTSLEFQYATFRLQPYVNNIKSSSKLLKDVIQKLNDKDFPSESRLIDRLKGQKGNRQRRLVHISSPFEKMGKRCFGRIALIKNKAPMIWGGKDVIEKIEKGIDKQFIEMTNYVIHFNDDGEPIVMVEFNSAGPRLSDIEYFFRQVAFEYNIATGIKSTYHLSTNYKDLDKNIVNIFNVVVKVGSNNLVNANDTNWHGPLKNLNDETGYRDVRMELFYGRKKDLFGKYLKNIQGLKFGRDIITWLKNKPENIEYVEDLKMTYQTNEDEEPIELDFIKNKSTSLVHIPLDYGSQYTNRVFKHHVGQEFNYYLTTGETNNEPIDTED
ncbi:MAG: hypothetical protein COB15_07800 [Flavobacteriales bacterium]|nr:MAG: hypothetical protein COB15_07800 [Flavobacteriales bacterium]